MIGGGEIGPLEALAFVQKIAIIDAVGMLLEEDKDSRWIGHLGCLEELPIAWIVGVISMEGKVSCVADHCVHRNAPHARAPTRLPLDVAESEIRRTLVNAHHPLTIRAYSSLG